MNLYSITSTKLTSSSSLTLTPWPITCAVVFDEGVCDRITLWIPTSNWSHNKLSFLSISTCEISMTLIRQKHIFITSTFTSKATEDFLKAVPAIEIQDVRNVFIWSSANELNKCIDYTQCSLHVVTYLHICIYIQNSLSFSQVTIIIAKQVHIHGSACTNGTGGWRGSQHCQIIFRRTCTVTAVASKI